MVENASATTDEPSSDVVQDKAPEKAKKKKKKSQTKSKTKDDVEWSNNSDVEDDDEELNSDGEWEAENPEKESPSTWDPKELEEQTNNIGAWKEQHGPRRVQDLPSPTLVEVPPEQRTLPSSDGEDEWPFTSPCAFEQKNKRRQQTLTHSHKDPSSETHSTGSSQTGTSSKKNKDSTKPPVGPTRKDSDDYVEDEENEDDGDQKEAWKMRESWKDSEDSDRPAPGSRRGRKTDVNADEPPKPKARADSVDDVDNEEGSRSSRSKRRATRRMSASSSAGASSNGDDIEGGSFHGLKKDADKKVLRSNSRGRKTPTGGRSRTTRNKTPTGGRPSRRKVKEKSNDDAAEDEDDVDISESMEDDGDIEKVKLKGDNSNTPGSRGSRERRKARKSSQSDDAGGDYESDLGPAEAPRSAGKRPPTARRSQMRRVQSERWRQTVEVDDEETAEAIKQRAQVTLNRANRELSQSAHNVRRYHSGGHGSLDRRSYHGGGEPVRRTHSDGKRTPRRPIKQYEDVDSGGSFGGDDSNDEYDAGSVHTYDSYDDYEDYEDFGGPEFQTPGMVAFDAEVLDLMQRDVPETTAHLDRRVHRKREQVLYDQNMPLMTRQALLTRQASAQAARQVVDGSTIDRKRLLLRSDSMSSVASHEDLSLSNHRSLRGPPGRRAPPRSRSSGLGAMVPGGGAPRPSDPEGRRGVFRTRSGTGTNSFQQYQNKPNRVQTTRRGSDQIDPHSMRGAPSSGDSMLRRRGLQRAKSTTSLRRPGGAEERVVTPQKPLRRRDENASDDDSDIEDDEDSDVVSEGESLTPSPRKPSRRVTPTRQAPARAKSDILPRKKPVVPRSTDKKDMTNKRNRRKLHLLMYEAKMGVEMKDLFQQVREGVTPRSPIKTLMMPSP